MNETQDFEKLLNAITGYCNKYFKGTCEDAEELAETVKKNFGQALEDLANNPEDPAAIELLQESEEQFYDLCEKMFAGVYRKYNIPLETDVVVQPEMHWRDMKPVSGHPLFYDNQLQKNAYVVKAFFDNYYSEESPETIYWIARVDNSANTFRALLEEIAKSLKKEDWKKEAKNLKNEIENVELYIDDEQIDIDQKVEDYLCADYYKTDAKDYLGFELHIDFGYEEAED